MEEPLRARGSSRLNWQPCCLDVDSGFYGVEEALGESSKNNGI